MQSMRLMVVATLGFFAGGCTIERMQQDTSYGLGAAHLEPQLSIERSSRWRIDDPGYLTLVAEYDPNDRRQVEFLNAAYLGINRVYPQTVLDELPAAAGAAPRWSADPAALFIHVDMPPAASRGVARFPVALIDGRTGFVIDRATLTLRSSWWGSAANDPAEVTQLFYNYASQLRPSQ